MPLLRSKLTYQNAVLITFCLIDIGFWASDSKGATHWRFENGEVNAIFGEEESVMKNDPIFRILANPISSPGQDSPILKPGKKNSTSLETLNFSSNNNSSLSRALVPATTSAAKFIASQLTCGDPVNETIIDHLEGIATRFQHPANPEPEVIMLFRKNEFDTVQLDVLEVNLLDALKLAENSVVLYNQIGNFLRIKGDTYHAIECFRKALYTSTTSIDSFLNLARMMANLSYIKDAVHLAQLSLDVAVSTEQTRWLQHYTLGELHEKNGDKEKAYLHFDSALFENPAFHPAFHNLKRLGTNTSSSYTNIYTVILIGILCFGILVYLYVNVIKDSDNNNNIYDGKHSSFFRR